MSLIDKVIGIIETNRKKEYNCIPFDEIFPRFSNYIPGVKKGTYYCVTGAPSAAKTQLTDFAFLYHPYEFCKLNNIKVDITYFSFEISKEAKVLNGISRKLFLDHGIKVGSNYLQSIKHVLSEEILAKVLKVKDYFTDLENYVTFYDEPLTASQIYDVMWEKIKENGELIYEDKIVEDSAGRKRMKKVLSSYLSHDPDKYLIFITDHISLIQPEHGQTLRQALATYSANNVNLRNKFGITVVNVQQQGLEGSVEQFTNKGDSVLGKVEPQLWQLGDNRTLSRDYDIVLGMFSPFKYEIAFHRGYNAKKFEDNYRSLSILKNREGVPDMHVGLYFDGSVNYFEELPKADAFYTKKNGAKEDNDALYDQYIKGQVGLNKQKTFNFY